MMASVRRLEGSVCDLGPEVLGHLVAVLDPADFLGDLGS